MFGVQVFKIDTLIALLQKELRPSDVGNLGRIIGPKVSLPIWDKYMNMMFAVSYLCGFHYGLGFFGHVLNLGFYLLCCRKRQRRICRFLL